MKKLTYTLSTIGIISTLMLAGCGAKETAAIPQQSKNTVLYSASYPTYTNVEELIGRSNLIIEGTIIDSNFETINITQNPTDPSDEKSNPGIGAHEQMLTPYTVYDVEVHKVYKGNVAAKDIIQVKQLGGEDANNIYVLEDSLKLKKQDKVIMFLETYDNAPASLLNPIQALYQIQDDKIIKHEKNAIKLELKDLLNIKQK